MALTTLYRFYDADDRLLYIGISEKGPERWKAHRKDKPWWTDVARSTTEHYETRAEALEAERAAIIAEKPLHNVVHNRRRSVAGSRSGGWAQGAATDIVECEPTHTHDLLHMNRGDVVAVLTHSDDFPPVGIVTGVAMAGFTLRLYQWHTLQFGGKQVLVTWRDVVRILYAEVQDVIDGITVYDMDPLADFQSEHRRDKCPTCGSTRRKLTKRGCRRTSSNNYMDPWHLDAEVT
jgi:hypothetical protein